MVSIEREGSTLQGSEYRDHLNNNWKTIEDELNRLGNLAEADSEQTATVTPQELQNQISSLQQRINRIVLGTDQEAIQLVVTTILQEKGLIN